MKHTLTYLGIRGVLAFPACCATVDIGLREGGLAPCPDRPNCVSSQARDEKHRIEPLSYRGSREWAYENLKAVIGRMGHARIIADTEDYLHVEFRSRWLKFIDDVEFWFPEKVSLIHIRSASRVGYSDLGVNRKRTDRIRALFMESDFSSIR